MIKFIWLIFAVLYILPAEAQEALFYQKKISRYNQMKDNSRILIFAGVPVIFAGSVLFVQGMHNESINANSSGAVSRQVSGGAMFLAGTGALITGVILNSYAEWKAEEFQAKLDAVNMSVYLGPSGGGISINYRF